MSDKKILAINPDLFSFSNTTKKKKEPKPKSSSRIQMKPSSVTRNNETLRKKSILRMIRQHHTDKNKENFTNYEKTAKVTTPTTGSDFETAKDFFSNMVVDKTNKDKYNYTLKKPYQTNSNIEQKYETVAPNTIQPVSIQTNSNIDESTINLKKQNEISVPKYGCLKNGLLPTYRSYINQTRRNNDENVMTIPDVITTPNNTDTMYIGDGGGDGGSILTPSEKSTNIANIMSQTNDKLKNLKKKKRQYRKKTIKRTFSLGKSKTKPAVSVLVTNKTIRNKIVEKEQLLKQTPLSEIRRYLMKHGFIKIGSTTPNDVLRKMYETALLICGEVQNHNSETLMYNFLNNNE